MAQAPNRNLKIVSFSGRGHELGLQHGNELKNEIRDIIAAWKKSASNSLNKDADEIIKEFFEYADFDGSIKKWTPELYEEIRGIAEGSGQPFNDIMILNLLDEFWVYIDNINNHHCSGMGVPARKGKPSYISQNMDLETYTDGFQVLMRLQRTKDSPEQLILTHPGLILLNGLNEEGIGACFNTLMQLEANATGLPVAFVGRRILNSTDKDDLLQFIQTVNHASGQNYIIGIRNEVYDFEASASKVVRFDPKNENGTIYHTNHPIVNDNVKPWFREFNPNAEEGLQLSGTNSHLRLKAVESRLKARKEIDVNLLKETLRSKDDANNPVCRTNNGNGRAFTFASTIMTLSKNPRIEILAGPPDESNYITVSFTPKN